MTCGLRASVDARDQDAIKYVDKLQVKYNELTHPSVAFQKWLSSLDNLEDIINSSQLLREHEFYLNEIVQNSKYLLQARNKR